DQEKSSFLFDYLFGENGIRPVTDEEKQTYYENNYSHIYHLYVNDAYYYPVTKEGYTQTDENGNLVSEPLTAEMLAEKNAVIEAVDAALAAGEDFIDVYDTYSEDKYYENGYYLTKTTDFIDEVVDAAFSLETGEYEKVRSDYGTHYVYRIPLDETPWRSEANTDFFETFDTTLSSELFVEYVRSFLTEVQVDREALASYSVEASPVNYRF
ncbi:MAG: peptidylprolyl isomerase, partial [Clostridia bacterium]|nr:peptidylprolyl isomerase [Clostridia bacterium]